ncbi:DNAj [Anaeramoeba flamelloides]|uniref:DNAj n=1 Tax=Anaeramoeba flamelloides TaxID=1746091 RepID=A0AAV7ZDP5_9EUKA|nr:DNAj [Anaeramoeba flamelloides]
MRFFVSSELILISLTLFQIVKGINTHYDTLGVSKEASIGQIRSQYLKLVKQYHPDMNKSPEAQKKFIDIQTAWEVLKDPQSKKKYDQSLLYPRNDQQTYSRGSSENGHGNTYRHQKFTFTTNTNQFHNSFFQFNANFDSFFKPNPNNFRSSQLLFEPDRNTISLTLYNFQQHFLNSVKSTVTICIAYNLSLESKALSQIWPILTKKYSKYGVKFFAFNIEHQPSLSNYFGINNFLAPQIFSIIEANENKNKYNKIVFNDLDYSSTKAIFLNNFDDYVRSLFEKNNKISLIKNFKEFNNAKNNPTLKFRPSILLILNNNNGNNNNNNKRQIQTPLFYYHFSLKHYRTLDFYLIKDSSICKNQLPNFKNKFILTIFNDKFDYNMKRKINWYTADDKLNNPYLIESYIFKHKQMVVTRISGEEVFNSICKIKDKYCVLWFTETNSKKFGTNLIKYQDFAKNTSTLLQRPVNFGFLDSINQKEFCSQFFKNFNNKIIVLNLLGNGLMRYIALDELNQLRSVDRGVKFPISSTYKRIQLKEEIFYNIKSNFNWYLYFIVPVFLLLISYLNCFKNFFNLG